MYFKALERNKDWSILLLRIVIAAIFLAHGYMKWANFDGLPTLMKILAVAEPIGGLALLIGLLTRWAATGLLVIMVGAIYTKVSGAAPFAGGWAYDAIIGAGCVMIMTLGAGKIALDAKMKR